MTDLLLYTYIYGLSLSDWLAIVWFCIAVIIIGYYAVYETTIKEAVITGQPTRESEVEIKSWNLIGDRED